MSLSQDTTKTLPYIFKENGREIEKEEIKNKGQKKNAELESKNNTFTSGSINQNK